MTWQDHRVLVTGADGFIGSHLAERLAKEGARVRAYVQYNSFSSWGWLDSTPKSLLRRMEVVAGDVRDAQHVETAARDCDTIFHLAALISIPHSYQAPQAFVETNVHGTLNVLQAARRWDTDRIVHTSTSEVYGTPAKVPIRETHPLQAQSPYAASKIAADKLAESFHHSFGVPVTVLRPFNTYGPRQSARAVLPTILTQVLSGNGTVSLGSLFPRRDLTYVDDTVDGFLRAATRRQAVGQVIQLGTGRDVSVGELAKLVLRVTGSSSRIRSQSARVRPKRSEVLRLVSDPARARKVLGWKPKVVLEDGVRKTAEWFRTNLTHYKVDQYVV